MGNRDELCAAIERKVPRRIPYTYEAAPETDQRVRQHLALPGDVDVGLHFQCNYATTPWEAMAEFWSSIPGRQEKHASADPNVRIDIWGCRTELVEVGGAKYWEITRNPLRDAETTRDIENYDWPRAEEGNFPAKPQGLDIAAYKEQNLVMHWGCANVFSIAWTMRGMDKLMMDLVLNPGLVDAIVAKIEEYQFGCLRIMFKKYPGLIDLVRSSDDWGSQRGLLISRDMVERFFMPAVGRLFGLAARHGARGYQHSCGSVFDIIPLLINAGVSVLNPIQTSAAGMDPARLKAEFGKDLCFHGGMDTQQTLVRGTPDEVRAEVRRRIDTLGPDGYILAPSHVLQPDVPPENIVALYEEAREYGASVCV